MITETPLYDGSLLHNRFAYQYFREKTLPIGNIIAFRAPMEVEADGMIDTEDIIKGEFIYSKDAINFLWEIPMLDNPVGAVAFQRLFNSQIANELHKIIGAPIELDGDDIIIHKEHSGGGIVQQKGKASVSITYCKNYAALGHTGINIDAGNKAPAHAFSTNLSDDEAQHFMGEVIASFYALADDLFIASSKCYNL